MTKRGIIKTKKIGKKGKMSQQFNTENIPSKAQRKKINKQRKKIDRENQLKLNASRKKDKKKKVSSKKNDSEEITEITFSQFNAFCRECNNFGHLKIDCTLNKKIQCTWCLKYGHRMDDCTTRKFIISEEDTKDLNVFCIYCEKVTNHLSCNSQFSDNKIISCFNCGSNKHSGLDCI
jgi:hypothetical protein